jgi:hypothetical protein
VAPEPEQRLIEEDVVTCDMGERQEVKEVGSLMGRDQRGIP